MYYKVKLERSENGTCVLECPYFKACYSSGDTIDEAIKNLEDVIRMCLEEIEVEGAEQVLEPEYRTLEITDPHTINIKIPLVMLDG
jgi:predicted RNase H-like HicB family nuclease